MKLTIPELSFVVLVGVSGSGKSTFARKHFKATEILSSDYCRGLVSDDENSQAATNDAFELLHFIARKRLAAAKLTVAIVLEVPERVAHERNKTRLDRDFGPHVVRQQAQQLRRSLRGLEREGFRHVHVLKSLEEVETTLIERQPLWNNLKHEHGPFDIIGDVHGCYDELVELLGKLGYEVAAEVTAPSATVESQSLLTSAATIRHPQGRKLVFVGDLVDRGPKIPQVLKLVMNAVASGTALCVPGNHDVKLMRKLRGRDVQITHGLAES